MMTFKLIGKYPEEVGQPINIKIKKCFFMKFKNLSESRLFLAISLIFRTFKLRF